MTKQIILKLLPARRVAVANILLLIGANTLATDRVTCIGETTYLKQTTESVKTSYDNARQKPLPQDAVSVQVSLNGGVSLRGYVLTSTTPQGTILLIQGNGTAARAMVNKLSEAGPLRYDIYIFDYRGHGENSDIQVTTIGSYAEDFLSIWRWLGALLPKDRYLAVYAQSQGGIVASTMLEDIADRSGTLILDGTPSRIPNVSVLFWTIFSCPITLDPVERLKNAAKLPKLAIIRGSLDRVITWRDSGELFELADSRGIRTTQLEGLYHPFTPRDDASKRIHKIEDLLDELKD